MTLCIVTITPEGIILAADSRQSFRNQKGFTRIGSDSASKIFKLNNEIGATTAGLAFLPENGILKSINKYIEDFKKQTDLSKKNVKDVAEELKNFFEKKYNYNDQLGKLPLQIKHKLEMQECTDIKFIKKPGHVEFSFKNKEGEKKTGTAQVEQLQFNVSGFNLDQSHQSLTLSIPGTRKENRNSKKKNIEYGANWLGQTDVISRLILGFDARIGNLPVMQSLSTRYPSDELRRQLGQLEYSIQWGTMTLHDAIDFCVLGIEITTAIQRFSDGIMGDPGDIPGVGGHIDVATITPQEGFQWISKKELKIRNKRNNLNN